MRTLKLLILFGVALLGTTSIFSCSKDVEGIKGNPNILIDQIATEDLTVQEIDIILYMREEEKLARDVYIAMYQKWNLNIFQNITSSEQSHMDAILQLIDRYKLVDPAQGKGVGEFSNKNLKQLYDDLIASGNNNLVDALTVGATIEDLDISDLKRDLTLVDNQDIIYVFENLYKGSRNHMRSYYSNLVSRGADYSPQYISQVEFDAIINSPKETGR